MTAAGPVFHVERCSGVEAGVPRETLERLRAFADLLAKWNRSVNLVSARSVEDLWHRHVLDSLQLLPLLPGVEGDLLDLGSGAGFPGIVLAAAAPRLAVTLVESDKRKAAFLTEGSARLGLGNVAVRCGRIEDAALPRARVLTARALAPLPVLLRHAHNALQSRGVALFPKGRKAEEELTAASRDWKMRVERFPSRTDPTATIFRISEIRPAGSEA